MKYMVICYDQYEHEWGVWWYGTNKNTAKKEFNEIKKREPRTKLVEVKVIAEQE